MKEKMKREMKRGEKQLFFLKNVSDPSNPPDELAQHVSKKNPFRTNYSSIFLQKFRISPFFYYLHDSNSIFRARRINSETFSGGTVVFMALPSRSLPHGFFSTGRNARSFYPRGGK